LEISYRYERGEIISSTSKTRCLICGQKGKILYRNLIDRIADIQGKWNIRKCENPECGLVWIDPVPDAEDIHKLYKKYYTHKIKEKKNDFIRGIYEIIKEGYFANKYGYNKNSIAFWKRVIGFLTYIHPLRRASLDYSVMHLGANRRGKLLDVGCGNGERIKLMRKLGWKVEGVDLDVIAVEKGRKDGLKIALGRLKDQNYIRNYFDAIIMSHVIEHVHDPVELLLECYRILKSKGILSIITPNIESWGHQIFADSWVNLDPPRHIHIFGCRSLAEIVNRANFKNIRIKTMLHGGDISFTWSLGIKKIGRVEPKYIKLKIKVCGWIMEIIEYIWIKIKKNRGEEIYLIAEK